MSTRSATVDVGQSNVSGLSRSQVLFFVPFVVFVAHTLEEMPAFADWVSAHFAPLTTETFTVSHIPLILLVLAASWRASRPAARTGWVILATAFQWQFAVNAGFHLGTAVLFGQYSPGMLTAATVALPATVYFFGRLRRERWLTSGQMVASMILGSVIAAAAIGVLFLG